jgi:hypothetical protein
MNRSALLRSMVFMAAPLAYGIVAYSAQFAADRAFDSRMRRDSSEVNANLQKHGASSQIVDDLATYHANLSHNVSGYVTTSNSATLASLMFMGVTIAGGFLFTLKGE